MRVEGGWSRQLLCNQVSRLFPPETSSIATFFLHGQVKTHVKPRHARLSYVSKRKRTFPPKPGRCCLFPKHCQKRGRCYLVHLCVITATTKRSLPYSGTPNEYEHMYYFKTKCLPVTSPGLASLRVMGLHPRKLSVVGSIGKGVYLSVTCLGVLLGWSGS